MGNDQNQNLSPEVQAFVEKSRAQQERLAEISRRSANEKGISKPAEGTPEVERSIEEIIASAKASAQRAHRTAQEALEISKIDEGVPSQQ